MSVRAKFKVDSVEHTASGGKAMQTIKMSPVISGSDENKEFFAYTPSGGITLGTVNAAAGDQFKSGQEVYVDFHPVD